MGRNHVFEVAQFQMAVRVDQSGCQDARQLFDVFAGCFDGLQIDDRSVCFRDQYMIGKQFFSIKKLIGLEFA